jgi:hypothetical protein
LAPSTGLVDPAVGTGLPAIPESIPNRIRWADRGRLVGVTGEHSEPPAAAAAARTGTAAAGIGNSAGSSAGEASAAEAARQVTVRRGVMVGRRTVTSSHLRRPPAAEPAAR